MKQLRKDWFSNWLLQNEEYKQDKILEFHKNENLGTKETSLKMKRSFVETVSITSIKKRGSEIEINYFDILENRNKAIKI